MAATNRYMERSLGEQQQIRASVENCFMKIGEESIIFVELDRLLGSYVVKCNQALRTVIGLVTFRCFDIFIKSGLNGIYQLNVVGCSSSAQNRMSHNIPIYQNTSKN